MRLRRESDGFHVVPAPVCAQSPQGHDVDRDNHQRPERIARKEEHLSDGVEADHGYAEPASQLVTCHNPECGEQLQDAEDEGDPPSAWIHGLIRGMTLVSTRDFPR